MRNPLALGVWAASATLVLVGCFDPDLSGPSATPPNAIIASTPSVTYLGTLPGFQYSEAMAINNAGQIVGRAWKLENGAFTHRAFLWDDGVMTDLGTMGSGNTFAWDINGAGTVLASTGTVAWVWQDGVRTSIGSVEARSIDDLGRVVGTRSQNGSIYAFMWQGGVTTNLTEGAGNAISNAGHVVGRRPDGKAFVWQNGLITTFRLRPDATGFDAYEINSAGDFVGRMHFPLNSQGGRLRAVVRKNSWHILPELSGMVASVAYGINETGDIVGSGDDKALYWQQGVVSDLGTPAGAISATAEDINDAAVVVGSVNIDGGTQAVRWNLPTPPIAPTSITGRFPLDPARIRLWWTDGSADEGLFELERRELVDDLWSDWSPRATVPADSTYYRDDTAVVETGTYQYRVRACNRGGCSGYTVSPPLSLQPPAGPANLVTTVVSTTRVDLTWTDTSINEDRFNLWRRLRNEDGTWAEWVQLGSPSYDSESYTDTSVAAGNTYLYRIRACNAGDCSTYTIGQSVRTRN